MNILRIMYCCIFICVLYPFQSIAALIDLDWKVQNDAALLLDTTTGFKWLDLSVTANQSYDDVSMQLQTGGTYNGFRYATQAEVLSLWTEANITDTSFNWVDNGEWQAVKGLADRLGTSTLFDPIGIATHALGIVDAGSSLDITQRWVMELSYHPDGLQIRTSSNHYILDTTFASVHYSSYLVEVSAVPLPAAIWLFGSGLLCLFGYRKIAC